MILCAPRIRQPVYTDLAETFRKLTFSEDGLAEASFAGHRLIVAHDPLCAQDQTARRRARIAELEAMAEKMVTRLDAQDAGQTARGRRASDRGAYGRFTRAVAEAELTRASSRQTMPRTGSAGRSTRRQSRRPSFSMASWR